MQVRYQLQNKIRITAISIIAFGIFSILFDVFVTPKATTYIDVLLFAAWLLSSLAFVWWLLHPRKFAVDYQGDKLVLNWVWFARTIWANQINRLEIIEKDLLVYKKNNQTKRYRFKNINQNDWEEFSKWLSNK